MARVSRLANPGFAKAVGEAYSNGCSRPEMAELFGVHVDTITDWVRDPRVQAHAARHAQERVNRILRVADRELERRLEDADDEEKMPTELLLKVRKELMSKAADAVLAGKAGDTPETINELASAVEDDPEIAEIMAAAFKAKQQRAKATT